MSFKSNLKTQIDSISSKVMDAEKNAEKKIRAAIKSTESLREKQLKNVERLMKRAQALRETEIAKKAERVAKDLENRAATGFEILLSRMNVPTRSEVERLHKKISALQKRLDEYEKNNKRS